MVAAAFKGHQDIVVAAVAAEADLAVKGDDGVTALAAADLARHGDIRRIIASALKGQEETPPLICAVKAGDAEAAAVLLRRWAPVSQTDARGRTALFWAAYGGSLDCLKVLLMARADARGANWFGVTPLMGPRAGDTSRSHGTCRPWGRCECSERFGKSAADWAREMGHADLAELLQSPVGTY